MSFVQDLRHLAPGKPQFVTPKPLAERLRQWELESASRSSEEIEQSLAEVSQALLARRQSGVVQSDETVDRIQQSIDEINAIREKLEATMSKDSLSAVDGKNYFMHPATLTTQARIEAEREYQRSSREAFAWWLKVLPELSDPNDAVPVEHITVREFQLAHDALRRARGEQI